MNAGLAGGGDHLIRIDLAKAGDVFSDGAVEQFDVLWQITQIRPQFITVDVLDVGPVQPDLAGVQRPDPQNGAGQSGFTGGAGTNDADDLVGFDLQVDPAQRRSLSARRHHHHAFQGQRPSGRRQRHIMWPFRNGVQQIVEAVVGGAGGDKAFPGANQQVNWSQRPAHQDGTGDHDAGADYMLYRQQGAQPQNQRLQQHSHHFTGRGQRPGPVTGQGLQTHHPGMALQPTLTDAREHPHSLQHFDIPQIALGVAGSSDRFGIGGSQRLAGGQLSCHGQRHHNQRCNDRKPAEPGMEQEQHRQIDRHPRHIKEGKQAIAGQKLTQVVEIV